MTTRTAKRIRTTFTFKSRDNAVRFEGWLRRNENDSDYGHPLFWVLRYESAAAWNVEYEYDADNPMARGVATGIDL